MSSFGVLRAAAFLALAWVSASAQTQVVPSLKNRPPVAAPTSQIEVAPIEVVRSASEVINDFGSGLIQGLLDSHGLKGAALVAAQDERVIVTRDFGCCTRLEEVLYSDLLAPIAVLQLIERRRFSLQDKVSDIVPDYDAPDVTVGQALTDQVEPVVIRQIVEASSGMDFRDYVSGNILPALATRGGQAVSPSQTIGRLLVALLNEGAVEDGRILQPASVQLMRQSGFSIHPMLPGWTYGFAEMRRNGWQALQRDVVLLGTPRIEARMVIVPDAGLAYFIAVEGRASSFFWRNLDNALFDRILPQTDSAAAEPGAMPAPGAAEAKALAGIYEASDEPLSTAAPLKSKGSRLVVRAEQDGSLHLSGGENAVLSPRPGGYWAEEGGNLNAVASGGRLVLSSGIYRPLPLWKRPVLFLSLALMAAFGAAGALYGSQRAQRADSPFSRLTLMLVGAVAAFLAVSLFVWHLLPVP